MIQDEVSGAAQKYWDQRTHVQGAFDDIDFLLFDRLLREQRAEGDLLEIGAYLGKSAIVLGVHARPNETVVINDVFESLGGTDADNEAENRATYPGLTREAFLQNYRSLVPSQPRIVEEFSQTITDHVVAKSIRFAHVDGGHLFQEVEHDVAAVQELLTPDGIVVFDDIRTLHAPGVAAAVWAAVSRGDLIPFCLSSAKFYGALTPSAAQANYESLRAWVASHPEVHSGTQRIHGHEVLLVEDPVIWTHKKLVRALVPPLVMQKLRPGPVPHLGT